MDDDAVFKALADPTRRQLLDELQREGGQSLTALEERLPMTRFGVMKHLRLLEDAGLVVTRRDGRAKLHYLNPVPIRVVHDRWVSRFAAPVAAELADMKRRLEEETMSADGTQEQPGEYRVVDGYGVMTVFEIYIKTSPDRLWRAITDGEARRRYTFGVSTTSDWTPGSPYTSGVPGVVEISRGENLVVEPPRRLVQSFDALWSDEVRAAGTSRVTWEIEPVGEDSCRLRVTHDQLPDEASGELFGGWPMILSGLKTLLEIGEDLTTPGSLRYAGAAG